jgi:hypothetical protein
MDFSKAFSSRSTAGLSASECLHAASDWLNSSSPRSSRSCQKTKADFRRRKMSVEASVRGCGLDSASAMNEEAWRSSSMASSLPWVRSVQTREANSGRPWSIHRPEAGWGRDCSANQALVRARTSLGATSLGSAVAESCAARKPASSKGSPGWSSSSSGERGVAPNSAARTGLRLSTAAAYGSATSGMGLMMVSGWPGAVTACCAVRKSEGVRIRRWRGRGLRR